MNLSEALAREGVARPARVLHGARTWRTVSVPALDSVPASGSPSVRRGGLPSAAEADAARMEARVTDAFNDGLLEGRRQADAEAAARDDAAGGSLVRRCEQLTSDYDAGLEDLERQLADRVLRLAMTMAERIACQAIERDDAAVVPVLRDALSRVAAPWRELEIVAHPVDTPVIDAWLQRRESPASAGTLVAVRADAGVTPGGCRIRIDETRLDATLESRIRRAFEAMGGDDAPARV